MYKNDLKRGNNGGKIRNAGMRRAAVSPTPFEIMQMQAASSRSEHVIPHVNHTRPSFPIEAEQNVDEPAFKENEYEREEKCNEEERLPDKEVCDDVQKIQNAPIGRDELLIGALLAFLLFSDGDNDIVLIGILIFLLI